MKHKFVMPTRATELNCLFKRIISRRLYVPFYLMMVINCSELFPLIHSYLQRSLVFLGFRLEMNLRCIYNGF